MNPKEKKQLSEADIRALFITPAIENAGWEPFRQIRREVTLAPGPVVVRGNVSVRNVNRKKFADYVLYWEPGTPVAVVEAKENNKTVSSGMQQALGYIDILEVPSAFSSNGDAFASHNKAANDGEEIETQIALDDFPSPAELWRRYKKYRGIEDEDQELLLAPYHQDTTDREPRYYQVEAINRTIEAVASGKNRVLLVMATGTGKTYTTFQIIWRLWKARKVKRVLFLADRNVLVDQTILNDFKPFGSVMTKIKNRKIDPAYEIHLGLYQAITGTTEEDKIFKSVSQDFFDLIVIDECHRGSASEDSAWREILEYFSGAVQLGLTATPKETKYVSSTTYFGEPIYTYSLKQGIDDGFLAPYKVIRIDIDRDLYGWTPPPGMKDDLGKLIGERTYNQKDMDRILILNQRTKVVAERVMKYLRATDPYAKTIIFCEDIDHADRMRAAITNAAPDLVLENSRYVMRITGDNKEGKDELGNFIDPESRYPVIATTSELLTTGVDAKTCKLIVLDKNINSMTIFKQIIGRGTRIDEDHNKYFFSIIDFKKATKHFRDANFDGDPVVVYEPGPDDDPVPPIYTPGDEIPDEIHEPEPLYKPRISGVSARIVGERVEYIDSDGNLVTESYKDFSRKTILAKYESLDNFLTQWNAAQKKAAILEELKKHGILLENLASDMGAKAKEYGDFDLICHIAWDQPPLTRKERANNVKKRNYFTRYGEKAREVLSALLDKYADEGLETLESTKVLSLKPFAEIGTPVEIINDVFGGKEYYERAISELEAELYQEQA